MVKNESIMLSKLRRINEKKSISRPDFKEKVYQKLMKMINLNTDKLDGIEVKSKIEM
jgi:hypothetical protein